ncbi:hypothetical protein [Prevotella sp. MA2016]|uniref:hypothetical protein n=1 Tax=Prevotella sp. MA2016 TaxID=1408310 RepID=UPI00048C7CB8|nr:hypothetical protein [Prevotella sp. MA2016]
MKPKDKLFKIYEQGESPENLDDIAYIMWSEDSVFNFSNYCFAYRQAAEALYEQFKRHNGDYAIKDPMGITLVFMYRHYMELTTKFLYMKFWPYVYGRRLSEEEIVRFIKDTGHNLHRIWQRLNPILFELSNRLENKFDIKAFGHYVSEFQRYDESSMRMRYPIDMKGNALETKSKRLDIRILHDYMEECMDKVDNLVGQWEDQIYWNDDEQLGNLFIEQYEDAKKDVEKFLEYQAEYAESYKKKHQAGGLKFYSLSDIASERLPEEVELERFLQRLADNHLLVIHNLYYIGSNRLRKIMAWKSAMDRQVQFRRSAGAICRCETNKFNTRMNRSELISTLMSKLPEMVYNAVNGCVEVYKNNQGVL